MSITYRRTWSKWRERNAGGACGRAWRELRERETDQIINRAYTIQVAVDMRTEEMCYQSPAILEQCLKPYLQGIQSCSNV